MGLMKFLKRELPVDDNKAYAIAIILVLLVCDMSRLPQDQISAKLILFSIRQYQRFVSPNIRGFVVCKFEPSCSQYGYLSVKYYGTFWGVPKAVWRLCRCNPFNSQCGYDPP